MEAGRYEPVRHVDKATAEELAGAAIITKAIGSVENVLKSLIDAAKTNPLIGILVALLIVDLLQQRKWISQGTATGMQVLIYSSAGIALTSEIIQDFTKLVSLSGNSNPSLFTPSVTTLVTAQEGQDISAALLSTLQKAKG